MARHGHGWQMPARRQMLTDFGGLPDVGLVLPRPNTGETHCSDLTPEDGAAAQHARLGWEASLASFWRTFASSTRRIPAWATPTTQDSLAPGRSLLGTVADLVASARIDLNLASRTEPVDSPRRLHDTRRAQGAAPVSVALMRRCSDAVPPTRTLGFSTKTPERPRFSAKL